VISRLIRTLIVKRSLRFDRINNTGKLRVPTDVHHFALLKAGHVRGEVEKY